MRIAYTFGLVPLLVLCIAVLLSGCATTAAQAPTATATRVRQPAPTATAVDSATATPTVPAPTAVPPAATATQIPATATATVRPSDTATKAPASSTPAPTATATPLPSATPLPAATALPVATPAPAIDFVVLSKRLMTREENGGRCDGNILFHVLVVDRAGNPLNGVVVHMLWDGARPEQIVDNPTGLNGPGRVDMFHTAGVFRLLVVKDTAGQAYSSQTADQLITDYPPDEWKRAAGYCSVDPGKCENCFGHYSYEVVFQRTW